MSSVSSYPSQGGPLGQPSGRAVAALTLGILALVAFLLLTLPSDLLLLDLAEVPILGAIAAALYPLALGPEILLSPLSLLLAIAAIVVGGRRARGPSATLARVGALLGWVAVALDVVSLGLIILSFQGTLKPLI